MQLIKQTKIDFMGRRRTSMIISAVLLALSLISIGFQGLNLGIDFTGGTIIEAGYDKPADLEKIRSVLAEGGFEGVTVQEFGKPEDVLIRIAPKEGVNSVQLSEDVFALLSAADEGVEKRRVEFVGPQVGEELTEDGGMAMLVALIGIFIYVALFRFEWRFGLGAIAALFHDVILTVGIFSILQLEFGLPVLAAILAVIGYSLNDTIVVFDRIRENFRKMRKGTPLEVINRSINNTLARTVMTSLTTLLVLFALFFLGGEAIHGFAFALIIGVVVGTYSSIYVAGTVVLGLGVSKADLMPPQKEGSEVDSMP